MPFDETFEGVLCEVVVACMGEVKKGENISFMLPFPCRNWARCSDKQEPHASSRQCSPTP